MPNLNPLDVHDWTGDFFTNEFEHRFHGRVSTSAEKGVALEYTIAANELPVGANRVHGVLSEGNKCTLLGSFSPRSQEIRISKGIETRHGKVGFPFFVLGHFVEQETKVSKVRCRFTNLEQFFYPLGSADYVPYHQEPLVEATAPFGKIEINLDATFAAMSKQIVSHVWSNSPEALQELQESYSRVVEKYPKSSFMLKKSLSINIDILPNEPESIQEAFSQVAHIYQLFAVLSFQAVYPTAVTMTHKDEREREVTSELLPSLLLDKRTIDIAKRELSFHERPINNRTIDLAKVLTKWLAMGDSFATVVSRIQTETEFRSEHSAQEEFVMSAAQLEGIAINDGSPQKLQKYAYSIERYSSDSVKKDINAILATASKEGPTKAIARLRNELVHLGKPRKMSEKLSLKEMILLGQYLQIVIVGYLLSRLGIDSSAIHAYQDFNTPRYLPQP